MKNTAGGGEAPRRLDGEESMLDGTRKINSVKNVAPLRNVMLLGALINKVKLREPEMPGMACFYGFSGYGKSQAATYNALEYDACWVEVKSVWSRKKFVEKVCEALGIPTARTIGDMVDKIGEELLKSGRPLLLDEADELCTDGMIKTVRDIYESSHGAAVIFIGEEGLPQKLRRWERIHNRMLDWVPAQPLDLREVGVLADLKCPELTIHPEVLQKVLAASNAVARRVVVNLNQIKDYALTVGKAEIAAGDLPKIKMFTGEAPSARRIVA